MYKVYADEFLIYDSVLEDYVITNGTLSKEVNKSGSFEFGVYQDHPYYDRIQKLKTIITVYKNDKLVFRGRVIDDSAGFYNDKVFTCEGELSFLLDSILRPYEFSGTPADYFRMMIANHNSQVDAEKQFTIGNITVEDKDQNNYIVRSNTNYIKTHTELTDKLLENLGGYLHITRNDGVSPIINYLADFPYKSNQTIRFGENLLDFTRKNSCESIVTAIIPLGAKLEDSEERLTIEGVNGGVDYIYDETAVQKYGWIFDVVTWDDVTIADNLLTKARTYLSNSILQNVTIELSALDLSMMDHSIDTFEVGDYIRIESEPHGIDTEFLLEKQSFDLLNPSSDKIVLGHTYASFTSETLANKNKNEKIEIIISDYEVNKPIIQTIANKLTVTVNKNYSTIQVYDPDTNVYSPNYTSTPLVLTPASEYRGKTVECSYVWKRVVSGTESNLSTGDTVSSSGVLTINRNLDTAQRMYKCYATYTNGSTSLVASTLVELTRLENGATGADGTSVRILGSYESESELKNAHPTGSIGDAYIVAGDLYVWCESPVGWSNVGKIQGEAGKDGTDATIQSPTEPEDKSLLWCDTSVTPPILKQWNGAEWIVINDYYEAMNSLREELVSDITQTADGIRLEVSENFYLKEDTDQLVSAVSSSLEQTKKDFQFTFETITADVDTLRGDVETEFETQRKYIRFEDGNIILGESGNELTFKLENDKIAFIQNGNDVAYFSHNKLYVTDSEFLHSVKIGTFAFIPRANGNLSFKKVR